MSVTGEALLLGGYDRQHGGYVGFLEGSGVERERHGQRPSAVGVTQAQEQLYSFRTGELEDERLILAEGQLGTWRGIDFGVGTFISQSNPRESGVFVYGAVGSATAGGGVTLNVNFEAQQRELMAREGFNVPPGYLPPPVNISEGFGPAVFTGVLREFGVDPGASMRAVARREGFNIAPPDSNHPAVNMDSFGRAVFQGVINWMFNRGAR